MKLVTKRCRYCRRLYTYQMSGYIIPDADVSDNPMYCPECMKIINAALKEKRQPIKFVIERVTDETEIKKVLDAISVVRKKNEEKRKPGEIIPQIRQYMNIQIPELQHCSSVEKCFIDDYIYYLGDNTELYCEYEYDPEEKKILGKRFNENRRENQIMPVDIPKIYHYSDVKIRPICNPKGNLFFIDYKL